MLEKSQYLRESSEMSADPLSDILQLTKAESLVTGGITAGGPWAIRFPAPSSIKFFAVLKGLCWVRIDGEAEPIRFDTGDVGLITARRAFVLASDPALPAVDAMELFRCAATSTPQIGNGQDFAHIGGHVLLDDASGELLARALPPWIHVRAATRQATAFRGLLEQLVEEQGDERPGGRLASAQLAQLLFIQILRAHMQADAAKPASWLRAMCDRRVSPALSLMHDDPARDWHLEELAEACAMSRTTFTLRFKAAAGCAPLTYLAEWRISLAKQALREGTSTVAVIAEAVGYTSESAFSNAFKRMTGQSPRSYRQSVGPTEALES
jgi:AraC-like DNA-binding protein